MMHVLEGTRYSVSSSDPLSDVCFDTTISFRRVHNENESKYLIKDVINLESNTLRIKKITLPS